MMANNYHQALITAYEDEVGGAAYFKALTNIFTEATQVEKLLVLAQLEKQTTDALYTLIKRHNLTTTEPKEHISQKAIIEAKQSQSKSWQELMAYFARDFPPYINQFQQTLDSAPDVDKPILKQTIEHEVALVEFVQLELNNATNSLDCIKQHLKKYAVGTNTL